MLRAGVKSDLYKSQWSSGTGKTLDCGVLGPRVEAHRGGLVFTLVYSTVDSDLIYFTVLLLSPAVTARPPVDGQWSVWSEWSACSVCGPGYQSRVRYCDSPAPDDAGRPCIGNDEQWQACSYGHCQGQQRWAGRTGYVLGCATHFHESKSVISFLCE